MANLRRNVRHFVAGYVLGRVDGDPSPARFWYLPEPALVTSPTSLDRYIASATPSPLYLMDYRRKLEYKNVGRDGIIVLNYGPGIGRRINPEAAFQFAL